MATELTFPKSGTSTKAGEGQSDLQAHQDPGGGPVMFGSDCEQYLEQSFALCFWSLRLCNSPLPKPGEAAQRNHSWQRISRSLWAISWKWVHFTEIHSQKWVCIYLNCGWTESFVSGGWIPLYYRTKMREKTWSESISTDSKDFPSSTTRVLPLPGLMVPVTGTSQGGSEHCSCETEFKAFYILCSINSEA